jgi:hypothetical protein
MARRITYLKYCDECDRPRECAETEMTVNVNGKISYREAYLCKRCWKDVRGKSHEYRVFTIHPDGTCSPWQTQITTYKLVK